MNFFKTIDVKKLLFIFLLCGGSFLIHAQEGMELGGHVGTSYYFGDLNTSLNLSKPGFAAGIDARYNFNNRLCFKIGFNYGNISGDDALSDNSYEQTRNLSFKSMIVDGIAQFEFNFMPYMHGSKDEFFSPYLFAGLCSYYFNPKTLYNGEWVPLRPLGTEGQFRGEEYYTIQGGIVYGAGLKIDLNYEWSINIELSGRRLFTDYLDDVSGTYADKDDLESLRGQMAVDLSDRSYEIEGIEAPIGEIGRQRGNSNDKDKYTFITIGVMYYFGDIRCPPYSR